MLQIYLGGEPATFSTPDFDALLWITGESRKSEGELMSMRPHPRKRAKNHENNNF